MKEVLADMVRQVAPLFTAVRVTGSEAGTKVEAYTEDKTLFLIASFKTVIPDFAGEFGISNLSMLKGLLDFASYKTDDAKFTVNRTDRDDLNFVSEFHFKDGKGAETRFKTMNPKMVGEQATIKNIDWELSISPSKGKIEEIAKLSSLLAEVEKVFGLKVENDTLFLTLGGNSEVRHSATVALTEGETVDGKLINSNPWFYNTAQLLMILKNAGSAKSSVKFSSRGVIGVTVETEKGEYTYFLRGKPEN
jgi:hypothetical protein